MVNRQIYNSLERIHRQRAGKSSTDCWWHYDGGQE